MNDIIIQPNHDLGSLRLKIEYKEDHILPSVHYEPLLELLVNSLDNPEVCELLRFEMSQLFEKD